MMVRASLLQNESGRSVAAAHPVSQWSVRYSQNRPSEHHESEGKTMSSTNGTNRRSVVGRRHNKTCMATSKNGNQDWLAAEISSYSVQDVVDATGMSPTAVQNIRRKKAKLSFDNLTSMCQAHPEFAARYAAFVGLILPGDAEFSGAFTRAVNAHLQRNA